MKLEAYIQVRFTFMNMFLLKKALSLFFHCFHYDNAVKSNLSKGTYGNKYIWCKVFSGHRTGPNLLDIKSFGRCCGL